MRDVKVKNGGEFRSLSPYDLDSGGRNRPCTAKGNADVVQVRLHGRLPEEAAVGAGDPRLSMPTRWSPLSGSPNSEIADDAYLITLNYNP